ncbi:MAG: ribonuclease HII, partial [Clostridia bacterium]
HLPFPVLPIIGGDGRSYNVAAASIVAKVVRDRQMRAYAQRYPQYGFEHNMGYGTAQHIAALREYGATPEHRRSFIGKFISEGVGK